ncbi:RNA methyltransferase [Candidatus Gracilibacteria bacterium]|nr:RNA methyltransferase [Candidatus Gracilibacteria bacterium]NJS41234.1 RNA methyltransferase [Candidatus Gracilibacteria bacterium]
MNPIIKKFQEAKNNNKLVILEGFHPIKHALRFGAVINKIYTNDIKNLNLLIQSNSPDLTDQFQKKVTLIDTEIYNQLCKHTPKTFAVAIASKPQYYFEESIKKPGVVVFLENIKSLDNFGAVVRVCAARSILAVCLSGTIDPFHSTCLRASRGLHFAIPIFKINTLPKTSKSIIVFDENGTNLTKNSLPKNAILVFGSERVGVSSLTKEKADKIVCIPMQPKVSSLNLATSVAIAIYS